MSILDCIDIVIEYGASRSVPYLIINGNNLLEILTNSDVLNLCHVMRDIVGIYILLSTVLGIINNIHLLVDGKFKIGGIDYDLGGIYWEDDLGRGYKS